MIDPQWLEPISSQEILEALGFYCIFTVLTVSQEDMSTMNNVRT